jgi:hypothetical protein
VRELSSFNHEEDDREDQVDKEAAKYHTTPAN